jgi:hypothetical protein
VCLYKQLSTAFNAAFDPLAHLGEHTINNADSADFHLPEIGSLLGASTPPARSSHKVRETQKFVTLATVNLSLHLCLQELTPRIPAMTRVPERCEAIPSLPVDGTIREANVSHLRRAIGAPS